MRTKFKIISVLSLVATYALVGPSLIYGAVSLPWSTTYNCSEWSQNGLDPNCDGLQKCGDGTTSKGSKEQITSSANYSQGGGGRGQRHWIGGGNGGVNDYSGGTTIYFNSGKPEVWIRWYMRFEPGFYWAGYDGFKILYFQEGTWVNNNYFLIGMSSNGGIDYYAQNGDQKHYRNTQNFGWTDIHGGAKSNGSWSCYEVYIKSESGASKNDGIFRAWVNGMLKINATNVNHGLASKGKSITGFYIGSNAKTYPTDQPDRYVDFDDFVVVATKPSKQDSNGNYMIGPLNYSSTDDKSLVGSPNSIRIVQ